jgi:hypothetical protein
MWDSWWAKWQVFSEYFGFPCQSSFHQLLHKHHRSSGAGTIGQQWPTYQVDSVSPHPAKLKKKLSGLLDYLILFIVRYSKNTMFRNLICFRPQVRGWETPALLGPLERAALSHWIQSKTPLIPKFDKLISFNSPTNIKQGITHGNNERNNFAVEVSYYGM